MLGDLGTTAHGRTTNSTVQAMKPGQKEPAIKASILEVKKKAAESTSGLMDQYMKASGATTKLKASEFTSGLTAENTTDSGEGMICLGMAFTYIQME